MSTLGQKQTGAVHGMSALPPIADMCGAKRDVRFVPKADIDVCQTFNPLRVKMRTKSRSTNRNVYA